MEPVHHATVQQLPAHGHCQLYPIVPDSRIIILDGFNHIFDFLRHFQLGELHQLAQRVVTLDEDTEDFSLSRSFSDVPVTTKGISSQLCSGTLKIGGYWILCSQASSLRW